MLLPPGAANGGMERLRIAVVALAAVAVAAVVLTGVGLLTSLSALLTGPLVAPAAVVLLLVVVSVLAAAYLGVAPLATTESRYW